MEISPENALASYLLGRKHKPNVPDDDREEALRRVRHMVGSGIEYGRILPRLRQTQSPKDTVFGVSVQELSAQVPYDLLGEHDIQTVLIDLAVHARGGQAGKQGKKLCGYLRLALSNYVGEWSYHEADGKQAWMEVHGLQAQRWFGEAYSARDGSSDWVYMWRTVLYLTIRQTVLMAGRSDMA